MSTVEERVSSLEAKVDGIAGLRVDLHQLRQDMNRQFTEVREDMNRQFTEAREDTRQLREDMNRGFDQADRYFLWVVGIQFALFISVIGILLRATYR